MPQTYYIDGYNVLHRSNLLRSLASQDLETAREGLIEKAAAFCVATGHKAIIVFDGRVDNATTTTANVRGASGLQVMYSPGNLSADSVIEREVYRIQNKMQVVVVSNDQGIRDLCSGMGAFVMDSGNFLNSVREVRQDTSAVIERTLRGIPEFLENSLDDDSLARLKELRDKL